MGRGCLDETDIIWFIAFTNVRCMVGISFLYGGNIMTQDAKIVEYLERAQALIQELQLAQKPGLEKQWNVYEIAKMIQLEENRSKDEISKITMPLPRSQSYYDDLMDQTLGKVRDD